MSSEPSTVLPELVLIAAMARDRVIGRDGGMPWHLPADLKHFKAVTMGHPVIMGRKTFESIGRALPGRLNIVVSRSNPTLPAGVVLADSLDAALAAASEATAVMVIGGGQIYRQALERADRLELTLIDAQIEGDTHFPAIEWANWRLVAMRSRPADGGNAWPLRFLSLERGR